MPDAKQIVIQQNTYDVKDERARTIICDLLGGGISEKEIIKTSSTVKVTSIVDLIYPIGSLYWSSKDTNPSTLFGGTWVQIKDRFVWAKGDNDTVNATGGDKTKNISVDNLPSHNHTYTPSGTITMDSHSHGLNSHTHSFTPEGSVQSHSHNMQGHTHLFTPEGTVSSHTHGLNNHTHSFTPSGKVSSHNHRFKWTGWHKHDIADWINNNSNPDGGQDSRSDNSYGYLTSRMDRNWYTYPYLTLKENFVKEQAIEIDSDTWSVAPEFNGIEGNTGGNSEDTTPTQPTFTGTQKRTLGNSQYTSFTEPKFTGKDGTTDAASGNTVDATSTGSFSGTQGTTSSEGSGTALDIMPPYVVKYCWERTA